MAELQKGSKKLLNAWAFYDWANSVYTLTIASSIFPIFYSALFLSEIKKVHAFGFEFKSTALITFVTAFTFLVVTFTSPLLSGVADYVGNKKAFMKFFCYTGGIGCIGLYWFSLDHIHLSLLFYFMGLIGYWGSLVFYNSYLPDIAFPEQQDSISAKGFSMGYIGSVLLLVINLIMVMSQENGEDKMQMMRYSFITVGLWWILFSQYTFYILPKGVSTGHKVTRAVLFNGFKELQRIWHKTKENIALKRYLAAFFVYSMAVQTIMLVATYFGIEELDWGTQDATTGLIISILLIQLVAVLGATLTSRLSSKLGNIKVLIGLNLIWIAICAFAYFIETPVQFYITAAFVGLVMGGIQSLSRSTYSKLLPENAIDTASYFSFYDVSEKIGIVIGMLSYGFIAEKTGSIRTTILFFIVFFVLGVIFLLRVPKQSVKIK